MKRSAGLLESFSKPVQKRRFYAGFALLLCPLLCLSLLSGCLQAEEPEEEPDDLIEAPPPEQVADAAETGLPEAFALPVSTEDSLDPIVCPDGMNQTVASLVCEGLFRLNTKLEPVACLCDSFACDEAGTGYTIVLKQNITFSDGTPLTANEVKASLDRARDSARYGTRLRQIASIRAAWDTLFLTLYTPNRNLAALLDVPIFKNVNGVPVGTGPYYLTRETGALSLRENPNWWKGGKRPVSEIRLVESRNAMLYRFTAGDVHLVSVNLLDGDAGTLTGAIRCQNVHTTSFHYLACNVSRPQMNSEPFRKALSMGINRSGLAASLLSGHVLPTQFPVSPASSLYPAALEQAFSTSAFQEALQKSGYRPDRTLSLVVCGENPLKVSVAEAIATSLTEAGVLVKAVKLDREAYQEALASRDFDLCYCQANLTADWNLAPLMAAGGALNTGGWGGASADRLLSAYANAGDRAAAMKELCKYVQEHAPFLPLWFGYDSVLSASDVVENLIPTFREPLYNLPDCVIHVKKAEASAGTA